MDNSQDTSQQVDKKPGQDDSRFKIFLRSAFRYSAITLISLALASLLVWLVFIRPVSMELEQAKSDLQVAQTTTSDLQDEVARLGAIEAELTQTRGQRDLLGLLADVNAARFSLAEDDLNAALGALADSDAILDSVLENLGEEYAEQIAEMRARLKLANDEIVGADKFSAQRDLEVLANLILSLNTQLLGE